MEGFGSRFSKARLAVLFGLAHDRIALASCTFAVSLKDNGILRSHGITCKYLEQYVFTVPTPFEQLRPLKVFPDRTSGANQLRLSTAPHRKRQVRH